MLTQPSSTHRDPSPLQTKILIGSARVYTEWILAGILTAPIPLFGRVGGPFKSGSRRWRGQTPHQQWWHGSGLSCARGSQCRCSLCVSSHCHFYWWMGPAPYIYFIFFSFLPWKSKSGSWVGREPAKMNSNEPISIEIGSLPCQWMIKPNALNSLQQTRCWRQCPPSCLQEITHNFKIKRIKIEVGVYSYVHTSVPLQDPF